jgi:hypothetical protein
MTNRNMARFGGVVADNVLARLRGAQAARVVAYDRARQVVDVEFVLPQTVRRLDDEGEEQVDFRPQPGVDEVPVAFLGTPAAGLTFNIPIGTEGAYIPWERDHSDYQVTGAPPVEQRNLERHTLGCGGIFIPMCVAFEENVPADDDGATVLAGPLVYLADTVGAEAMARADRVNAQLRELADRLYFLESYLNQLQPLLAAAGALLTIPPPAFTQVAGVPVPPTGVPVGAWLGWANTPPWVTPGQTPPAGYAGTGDTAADRVRGV